VLALKFETMAKTQAKQSVVCIDNEGRVASLPEAKKIVITVAASRPDPRFLHRIELEDLETKQRHKPKML